MSKAPTDRELLEQWHEASLMDRRGIESELHRRMPKPGPVEEALVGALIRDTRKPKATRKRKPAKRAA